VLEADQIPYFQLFILRAVATLKRKPFTVTWHEVWSRSYWREYLGWAGWIAWSVEWLAMHLPDQIIAASPQTADRLRAILGERRPITPIPNGIDLSNVSAVCPDAEESDLVVVGRLMNHKRVDLLLQVIALLHAEGMPVTCRIIGDGPDRAALQEQARRLQILPAVEFRNDVSEQKELYALVKAARLFVSLSAREGFGIAVLEAIACGVPVLTTSEPDNFAQHLVARYSKGVVCEPRLEHIATAVKQVLAEHQDYPERGYGPESWVAEYDWETMADRLAGVYQA
jgi:glycosyltransferase involved in cell wall biosynthesis